MSNDQVDVAALGERLKNRLRDVYWYETALFTNPYPFLAECWPYPQLRVEILHRMAGWDDARRQAFIECVEAYLPKKSESEYDGGRVADGMANYNFATFGAPGLGRTHASLADWDKATASTDEYSASKTGSLKAMERWKAHPASGGGEVAQSEEPEWVVNDHIYRAFVDECCEVRRDYGVKSESELEPAYKRWRVLNADRFGIVTWNDAAFSNMRNWFHEHYKGFRLYWADPSGCTMFYGVRLKDREPIETETEPKILDSLSDMSPISTNEGMKILQKAWIDKHGPAKWSYQKYNMANLIDPDTDELDPDFMSEDDKLKYAQASWVEQHGPIKTQDEYLRMVGDTIGIDDSAAVRTALGGIVVKTDDQLTVEDIPSVEDTSAAGSAEVRGIGIETAIDAVSDGTKTFHPIYTDFVNDRCVLDDDAETPVADLWRRFQLYAAVHGSGKVIRSRITFGQFLAALGLERYRIKTTGCTGYRGIRLRTDEDEV